MTFFTPSKDERIVLTIFFICLLWKYLIAPEYYQVHCQDYCLQETTPTEKSCVLRKVLVTRKLELVTLSLVQHNGI